MDPVYYHSLKLLHILSATLLIGTGIGSVYYMWRADRSNQLDTIALTSKHLVTADWLFTLPAAIVQPITGILMAQHLGIKFNTPWLFSSIGLYMLMGCCWIPVVWIQIRVASITQQSVVNKTSLPKRYHQLMRYWYALGVPAFVAILAIVYFMVFKPY